MKDTITLAMIVRNEAENLRSCLESVQGQVDEIVIVDTGSTDETVNIARQFTDKVYSFPWHNDFSAARNFAIAQATGAWILSLDADEELVVESGSLREVITSETAAYLLPLYNPVSDSPEQYNVFHVLRLFQNNGKYKFTGKIHEQVAISEPNTVGLAQKVAIRHKMLPLKERHRKRGRNLQLLKKACSDDPHNPFLQYYLGVEWLMLGKPAQALPHLSQAYQNLTDQNLLFRAPAIRYLIICLHALGKLDEGICLCLDTSIRYSDYTDIFYLGGILLEEKQEYKLALKWFTAAIQSGNPPPFYSHLTGSESFLAYYHLGHCYEKLGQTDEALKAYEQALAANPGYIYPIYNIFLLWQAKYGLDSTLQYLKGKGYLRYPSLSLAVAGLFYLADYPGLARQCLEQCNLEEIKDAEFLFFLGKYAIFSGKIGEGVKCLSLVPPNNAFYSQAKIHTAVAYLLSGNFPVARKQALELFKNHYTRCEGYLLFCLIRLMEKEEKINYAAKIRETDVGQKAMELFLDCKRYRPAHYRQPNTLTERLHENLETFIKNTGSQGYKKLCDYYQTRIADLRSMFENKFGKGWVRL